MTFKRLRRFIFMVKISSVSQSFAILQIVYHFCIFVFPHSSQFHFAFSTIWKQTAIAKTHTYIHKFIHTYICARAIWQHHLLGTVSNYVLCEHTSLLHQYYISIRIGTLSLHCIVWQCDFQNIRNSKSLTFRAGRSRIWFQIPRYAISKLHISV